MEPFAGADLAATNVPPSVGHPLGADNQGFDVLEELMIGGRAAGRAAKQFDAVNADEAGIEIGRRKNSRAFHYPGKPDADGAAPAKLARNLGDGARHPRRR